MQKCVNHRSKYFFFPNKRRSWASISFSGQELSLDNRWEVLNELIGIRTVWPELSLSAQAGLNADELLHGARFDPL